MPTLTLSVLPLQGPGQGRPSPSLYLTTLIHLRELPWVRRVTEPKGQVDPPLPHCWDPSTSTCTAARLCYQARDPWSVPASRRMSLSMKPAASLLWVCPLTQGFLQILQPSPFASLLRCMLIKSKISAARNIMQYTNCLGKRIRERIDLIWLYLSGCFCSSSSVLFCSS